MKSPGGGFSGSRVQRRVTTLGILACVLGGSGFAQQTAATLVGNATDTTGAVLPKVSIRAINLATNISRESNTDDSGNYSIPFLPAGDYSVTAVLSGFRESKVEQITLQVLQTARVDFKMQPGNVNERVEVNASAALLQTENAAVGTVIDSSKIVELPLNGRNFIQLAQLIPGVQPGTPGSITVRRGRGSVGQSDASYGATAASANGQRDTANRFFIDGIESMDYDAVTYSFSPSIDALAEFKVETSSYSAQSGQAPGGQVSMVTKSGTNSLHGTLWEFNRNNDFSQSYNAIAETSTTPPRLNRNQFGANVGGPVFIPKVYDGKDKTFFFFNWESGYAAQGAVAAYRIIPPAAIRTGNFSAVTNARTGAPISVIDPTTGAQFPGNIIPTNRLSQQSLTFLQFMPEPNTVNGANNFLSTPFSAVSYQRNYTTRIDHNLSSKDSLSGRYIFNDTYEAGIPFWGHDERNNLGRTQGVEASEIHIFSTAFINEFRFGWHHFGESEVFGTTNDAAYDVAGKMNLPLVSRLPAEYGPPSISISGPDGVFSVYDLQRQIGPRTRANGLLQYTDTVSLQRGTHFLKIGADLAQRLVAFEQARNPRGNFGFTGVYTGSALADFMLGYVRTAGINPTHTNTDLHDWTQAYFIQDDWKTTSRLTINLGLRYDYFAPYTQSDDRFDDIYQNGFVLSSVATPQNSPYGRGLLQPNRKDFGPRFGFAYRPSFGGDSVIRGGYGIYWTTQISNAIFAMAEGAQATSGASVIGNITGKPNIFFNDPFSSATSSSSSLPFAVSNDQNLRDSYIQQWNLNIQHKLPANIVLDVGYVGAKGTRLIVTFGDLNRPIQVVDPRTPGLASLNARRPDPDFPRAVTGDKSVGNSIYHALQAKLERRMASGLTFLTAYTWSKSISGPSDIGGQVGGGFYIGSPQDIYYLRGDRAVSGFDVTQRFVNTVLYDVPFFRGLHGAGKLLLDGWQASFILTAQSGFPTPVSSNLDTTGTGITSRPDLVAGQSGDLSSDKRTWQKWFNTNAFTQAAYGRFGTSPRTDAFRLPGLVNVDFSATKAFHFKETRSFEFRAEFFNLFNHYNPDPQTVDTSINSATFGAVGGGVQGITTRVIQLGGKFIF
jgi:outer membrane receptor protein involved in Fe transport